MTSVPKRILLVTGLSGAGKTTVLQTLEDLGWEVVDNLPLTLLAQLLATPPAASDGDWDRPLAIGLDTRTRGFDANRIVAQIKRMSQVAGQTVETLFLDCATPELLRRFSETRRRHPRAPDRPATDGVSEERELLAPLKRWADQMIDTTDTDPRTLKQQITNRFGRGSTAPTLTVMSFGFARGLPRNADLVFDMRFLRNPHWVPELRDMTGQDQPVIDYVAADEAYEPAVSRIEDLLITLLPRYQAEGKSYITVAIGCTGGRHRSVHITERVAERLRREGFSPTMEHRDLATPPRDGIERPRIADVGADTEAFQGMKAKA